MAFLSLLVCSLLVALSYSQPWWANGGEHHGGNGGNWGGGNGGNWGGGGGGNTGRKCECNLNCIDVKANGNTVRCRPGYTAVSCSCGKGCGSYNFRGSNTCFCQCDGMDWTSARCCRNV